MSDYPKVMTRGTEEVTVHHRAEQGDREADGFVACDGSRVTAVPTVPAVSEAQEEVSEPPTFGPADDGTGEGPTEGPADDDTHVKRGRKKK